MVKPSKKIVPIIVTCSVLLVLIAIIAITPGKSSNSTAKLPTLTVVSQVKTIQNKALEIDSDNDGLKDWEEVLWHTDPHNPDTAGDGMTDGEKVKEGRDPLKKGPNNFLKYNPFATSTATTSVPDKTATGAFAQDLFSEYMILKRTGQTITPEIEQNLLQQAAYSGSANNYISVAKVYSQADITITNDTSVTALKNYGNELGKLYAKNAQPPELNELYIAYTAVQNNDRQNLEKLDIIIKAYNNIIDGLQKIKTPRSVADIHVSILNDFSHTVNSVKLMQKIFTDPIASVPGFDEYDNVLKQIYTDHQQLKAVLDQNGVTFSSIEPGSILYK